MFMLLLAVDTAAPSGGIAVLRDSSLIGQVSTASDEAYSSRLFRQLDFLLGELKLQTKDFDIFAVAAGPGSFTGLRVGLTAVKGWAEVFSKPIVAISGLEAVAAQAPDSDKNGLVAPTLDARRGQIFAALYRHHGARFVQEEPEAVCTTAELLAKLAQRGQNEQIRFISPVASILESISETLNSNDGDLRRRAAFQIASPVLAPVIGRLAYERALRGEFIDALHLDANYIRRSDAELLWKTR